jgi:peptide/nickel transport system permease protein
LLLISMIIYGILSEAPGGPLTPYLQNPHITEADIIRLKHNMGLDKPIPVQYALWLTHIVRGDFGYSTSNSMDVLAALYDRMSATLTLMGCAFGFSLLVGVTLGIYSALKPYTWQDYAITTFAFFGQSMPVFWLALMMQLAFSVTGLTLFGYHFALPSAGIASQDNFDWGDRITHLILPVLVLSLLQIAQWSRFMRSSMLEVIKTDYVRTAAAKGLSRRVVVMKHAFKNALIPLVTILALSLPSIVGGAIITETIFAWPGMGRLFFNALGQFDFALLMGYLMIASFLVVFFNLLADVTYAWLDPRVKYS